MNIPLHQWGLSGNVFSYNQVSPPGDKVISGWETGSINKNSHACLDDDDNVEYL